MATEVTAEQAGKRLSSDCNSGVRPTAAVPWSQARVKDVSDMILGAVMLILLAPLMLVVAIAIKLDSPGPVFFAQDRVGVRRRRIGRWVVHEPSRFRIYKFRSMVDGADPAVHMAHIERYVEGGTVDGSAHARFKLAGDQRITWVGRILRRTSIDELPQLFNVLRREMSLVGPRPVPLYEARHYLDRCPERFWTLPGITGLWQVSGRCNLSAQEMFELDVKYVQDASLALDASILLRTIPTVLTGRGAG